MPRSGVQRASRRYWVKGKKSIENGKHNLWHLGYILPDGICYQSEMPSPDNPMGINTQALQVKLMFLFRRAYLWQHLQEMPTNLHRITIVGSADEAEGVLSDASLHHHDDVGVFTGSLMPSSGIHLRSKCKRGLGAPGRSWHQSFPRSRRN